MLWSGAAVSAFRPASGGGPTKTDHVVIVEPRWRQQCWWYQTTNCCRHGPIPPAESDVHRQISTDWGGLSTGERCNVFSPSLLWRVYHSRYLSRSTQPGHPSVGWCRSYCDGFFHCWRRNGKFCFAVGPVIQTVGILVYCMLA